MGRLHAERLGRDGRARIAAVFDVDRAAAASLQASFAPQARVAGRFEELFELAALDAAVISTPTQLHGEHAGAFLARGTAVLCEKPLARTRGEIVALVERARESRTLLCVGYQRRLLAVYRELRRLVRSGAGGPVRAVCSHNIENWQQTIAGTWRDDPQANFAGFIGDAGSHKIDAVFFTTGLKPIEVFARTRREDSRVETSASVSALLEGDVPLTMDFVGRAQTFREFLSVHCAEADFTLVDGVLSVGREGQTGIHPIAAADSNPVAAFLDGLTAGAENFAPGECALPVYDFTQGIVESARSGRSVGMAAG
jgi:predicted dehydrogenase